MALFFTRPFMSLNSAFLSQWPSKGASVAGFKDNLRQKAESGSAMIDQARSRFETLKAGGMLPSPQGVALAVLELTQKHDASIQTLTHLVQTDPAMSGRILRYANAVHGGSLRHIASLPHAIVFLGLFRVRQIALGFSLIDHYRSGACKAFRLSGLLDRVAGHRHHGAAGVGAGAMSAGRKFYLRPAVRHRPLGAGDGVPARIRRLLLENLPDLALSEQETLRFGLDHAALSAELLQDWGLPEIFYQAVRYHELPTEAPFAAGSRAQALTAALHFAAKVGALLNLDAAQRWERVPSLYHAAAQIGLEDHQVPPLVESVVGHWQDWGRELHLPTRDFSDIKLLLGLPPDPAQDENLSALVVLPMRVALVTSNAGTSAHPG
jgi:two-component system, cell cycle response regulator